MKKLLFSILIVFVTVASWGQIITSTPAFVTNDYTGVITLVYDASLGTAGLKDYTGTDVYAHAGVITSESTSNSDWKHAPTWGDNSEKYKLTSLGNNKWQLLITPNMASYYGLNTGEIVQKLAFVFRNGTSTKEGKDVGGADIFLPVYAAGLNVSITSPVDKSAAINSTEAVEVVSSISADLTLFVNGTSVKTAAASTALTYNITYTQYGDYQLIAQATASGVSVYDTVNVCVPSAPVSATMPSGVQDGINYSADGTSATLVLYTPSHKQDGTSIPAKQHIFVIGDFNNWIQSNSYQMKKDGDRWWFTVTGLTPGKLYGFQYLVDDDIRIADPYTELIQDPWNDKWINQYHNIYPNIPVYPEGKTTGLVGTLQSNKPAYNWEVADFKIDNPTNVVIYEMLLRDFTSEKDLEAAITKLDYLKTLGITAVELMPIQEFDGNNSWGYNPNNFFAADKAYGSPEMYKKFIDECHKRGMGVILDMVFNHATGLNAFAQLYWDSANNRPASDNPWMNPVTPNTYQFFNDFNHSFTGTRDYFKRVLKYWITEYKVDGYRLDYTKGLTQNSGTDNSYDNDRVSYLNEYYNAAKEANPNTMFILEHFVQPEESSLASAGMYLWSNNNKAYSQSAMGYQSNPSSSFSGMNSFPRHWVGYAESHDEERNFYNAKAFGNGVVKTDSIVRIARVPLNVAFMALTPGPKMMWEFEELGYDISGGNGDTGEKPAVWGWLNLAHRKDAYDKCSQIISLKRDYPNAFMAGNYALSIAESDWANGRRIAVTSDDLNMVMLGNFYPSTTVTTYPSFPKAGTWYELLSGDELNVTDQNMTLSLAGGELRIYTDRKVVNTEVHNTKSTANCTIYPNVTKGKVWINTNEEIEGVRVYNSQGALEREYKNTKEIDASNLQSGFYIMKISTNLGTSIQKFIRQ